MFRRHHGAVLFRLLGTGAEMRRRERVLVRGESGAREVREVGAEATGAKCVKHRGFVHDLLAGEVQQHGPGLKGRERFDVDHAARVGQ